MKERIKQLFLYFTKFRRITKLVREIPKEKVRNKFISFSAWLIILLIIGLSSILIIRKGSDRVKLLENTDKIGQIEKVVADSNVYNSKMDNFAKNFVTNYINIQKDKAEERKNILTNYYLKGLVDNVVNNNNILRNLQSIRLYSSEKIGNEDYLYKYVINYTIKENDNTKTKQELISVPLKIVEGNYAVSNSPYFSDIPKDVSMGEYQEKKIDLEKEVENKVEIETFIKDFFKKYTTYNLEEMKYLMQTPESISSKNLGEFKKIEVYKENNSYKVYAEVYLVDKDIKLTTLEKFTLNVTTKDSKYFVEKLEHN